MLRSLVSVQTVSIYNLTSLFLSWSPNETQTLSQQRETNSDQATIHQHKQHESKKQYTIHQTIRRLGLSILHGTHNTTHPPPNHKCWGIFTSIPASIDTQLNRFSSKQTETQYQQPSIYTEITSSCLHFTQHDVVNTPTTNQGSQKSSSLCIIHTPTAIHPKKPPPDIIRPNRHHHRGYIRRFSPCHCRSGPPRGIATPMLWITMVSCCSCRCRLGIGTRCQCHAPWYGWLCFETGCECLWFWGWEY